MRFQSSILSALSSHDADAVLLSFLPDIRWCVGFSGSNGLLLVRRQGDELDAHFVTDGRYKAQAAHEVADAQVHVPGYNLLPYMVEEGLFDGLNTVLFQKDYVTVEQQEDWASKVEDVSWKGASSVLTRAVAQKTDEEIEQILAAQRITERVFAYIIDFIEPGMTEQEVAARIIYEHLKRGAEKMSFDPIVASGANGALPHARPSSKKIQEGELLVMDMGCIVNGYASDMTRTIAIGQPSPKAREVYDTVLKAQNAAIEAAKADILSNVLDNVARQVIEEQGFGEYFSHGLGHGVGLQVHEWPRVSYHVSYPLPVRAAVTIEPGIYIPGEVGVRIEDIIVLEEDGCVNLTSAPKDLIVVE